MDIAFAHILHHKILKDLEKDIEDKYIPFRDITDINISPKKEKDCSKCGQSIYFCACTKYISQDNSFKLFHSLSNK